MLLPRSRRARALAAALAIVVVLGGGVAGAAWYASGIIGCRLVEPQRSAPDFQVQVVAQSPGQVRLRATSATGYCGTANVNWQKPGSWGLYWLGGYGEVGDVVALDERRREVTRAFSPRRGAPLPGQFARFDSLVYPEDPLQAHGLPFEEVTFPSNAGAMPAWLVRPAAAEGRTWVVVVHGRGAGRRDGLRILPALLRLGHPTLVIAYRNDFEAPGGQAGNYAFGADEWQDVEAAVRFALDRGAERVVLYGYSMGGAAVVAFLLDSPLAADVAGAVLDAPTLDYGRVIEDGLRDSGLVGPLAWLAVRLTEWRYGVDFGAVDYASRVDELRTPVLLFHGDADDIVPVEISDRFALRRPDIVTYERFEGAYHTRAWNSDPARYERALAAFLERVGEAVSPGVSP